jgi:hypothetical protein
LRSARVIDLQGLAALCGFADVKELQSAHHQWIEQTLENGTALRDERWSESIAVGSLAFVGRNGIDDQSGSCSVGSTLSQQLMPDVARVIQVDRFDCNRILSASKRATRV